ncbi:hypothetical protein BMF94_4104 [Rhodotorula taiwanensis]|uniref:EF-hand domain-containing protein n=1 Tax=Rhodotorula taiwanensis TaxID=741276 RepID=A0A2S5B7W0_9BASI|nr:hypothetical protein BMF94_4104 [Rhodotorula taiwanensis]
MPANYAKATAAFLPAGEPKPDPAFLDGLQPANRKIAPTHHSKLDSASNGAGAELTPPLTPPSESDNAQDEKELGAEKGTRTATEAGGLKQRKSANKSNGDDAQKAGKKDKKEAPGAGFAQSIKGTVSEERYVPTDLDERIAQPWVPRANIAATPEHPYGTTAGNYAELNKERPVLAQHVAFFDKDGDNILWPLDTWRGFREMGYNFFWCTFAMCVIHFFFSWFTAPGVLPDPFFRVFIKNGHRSKHGSDTAVYDSEGRFIPAKFEEIFTKFDKGNKGGLTFREGVHMIHAQRQAVDPIGWCAEAFEWASTYILIWPQDGLCDKESIRTVYDGSLFYIVAHAERQRRAERQKKRQQMSFVQKLVDSLPNPYRGWTTENRAGQFEWTEDKFHL